MKLVSAPTASLLFLFHVGVRCLCLLTLLGVQLPTYDLLKSALFAAGRLLSGGPGHGSAAEHPGGSQVQDARGSRYSAHGVFDKRRWLVPVRLRDHRPHPAGRVWSTQTDRTGDRNRHAGIVQFSDS